MKYLLLPGVLIALGSFSLAHSSDHELLKDALNHFKTIPNMKMDPKENAQVIKLGKKLYSEQKLSANKTVSCNTCHILENYGVDNKKTSIGVENKPLARNTPSTYNAVLNFVQGWDGQAADLSEMTSKHLLDKAIYGHGEKKLIEKSLDPKEYLSLFKKAFPKEKDPINFSNIVMAISSFQKTLLTPSRFDDFLKGQMNALSFGEKKGLRTFIDKGCVTCHSGVGIGGGMYMNLGLVEEYPTNDLGRYQITKKDSDKKVFKVPSLRNIEYTPPYLHDGSILSLGEMIKLMAKHQLGDQISENDINDITSFLKTLSAKKK